MVEGKGAGFEAKFMLPVVLGRKARPQNTWRSCSTTCGSPMPARPVLSIITEGWQVGADDPCRQSLPAPVITAERKFWRCVESGESPRLFLVEPPRPRI